MMRLFSISSILLLGLLVTTNVWAIPVSFTANGVDSNGNTISGIVSIDDQIQATSRGVHYSVTAFSFVSGNYNFMGSNGGLSCPWGRDPETLNPNDGTWAFNGFGDATSWHSPAGFFFQNEDGTFIGNDSMGHISFADYAQLAPIIYLPDNFAFGDLFEAGSLTLTMISNTQSKTTINPIPEPSVILTAVLSIAALIPLRYKLFSKG